MTQDLITRAKDLAVYIIETRATIRQTAKHFGISKSTVHVEVMVQNVSGGQSHRKTQQGREANRFPPVFCVMLPFLQLHLPFAHSGNG